VRFAKMTRTRLLITAAFVCHLLVAPRLVTSQLLSPPQAGGSSIPPSAPSAIKSEEVTICAVEQEKDGPIFHLRGKAEIHYATYILYADAADYNSDTGDATVDGHVILDGGPNDEHVEATHGTYNIRTEIGRFENVNGTAGFRIRARSAILTTSSPFAFSGKIVEKTGPDHYRVYYGTITTCELPHPKWEFHAHRLVVEVGGNAKIYRSTFRIRGIPVVYFPFATHPVERIPRQTGFLIPNIGHSSTKGTVAGESVYWAINPSMDATLGTQYYSMRGWAPQGEFRNRPSETSFVDLTFHSVLDRGIGHPKVDQGGTDIRLDAEGRFAGNFRSVAEIDYLSSFVYRLAFNDVFTEAINSEVKSQAFLSNTSHGSFYNASARLYQNFENDTPPLEEVKIVHAPSFEVSAVDRQLGGSPFYWSYDAALDGLYRSEPGFHTAPLVGRIDITPALSIPLIAGGWSFRPEISLRDTAYTEHLLRTSGIGVASSSAINRKALEGSVEIRPPAVDRIFGREFVGHKWKHVIEPRVTYRYVTGVNNFSEILRFDQRDILSDTNEVEYALVNRLYAKRTSDQPENCGPQGMPLLIVGRPAGTPSSVPWERRGQQQQTSCQLIPHVREIVTWELAQKYFFDPTFGGALRLGTRNVFSSTADFTGIAFLTDSTLRRFSPLISRLRFQPANRTEAQWDVDYDFKSGRVNASTAFVNYRFGLFTIAGGDAYLRAPGEAISSTHNVQNQGFHQFRALLGYGQTGKRGFSGATSLGFDQNLGFLQYSAVQLAYNWDCCGLNVEYRRFALGSVRNENQFRFTFALANVGAFGNLRRQEKLF
jgi:LPS-assembly protein